MSAPADSRASIFSAYDKYRRKRRAGGSKFPRIQLMGANSPRARIFFPAKGWPRVWHLGHRLSGLPINNIIKARYARQSKDARRHMNDWLRYVQERERAHEEPERKFFDNKRSQIEREDVRQDLLANQGQDIAFYKIILSPRQNELDHEAYTREIMTRWEEYTGIKTNWYAIKHSNTQYHHVHLVMPGLDIDGNSYRLNRDHLNLMREIANEHQYEIQDRSYQYEKTIELELGLDRDQIEKFLERQEGNDLMRELGVTSKDLEETVRNLLPPDTFDDAAFRKSLEDHSISKDEIDSKEEGQRKTPSENIGEPSDYVSPMEWSEHYASEDARESVERDAADREPDERNLDDLGGRDL